jgi:hypothetical protein
MLTNIAPPPISQGYQSARGIAPRNTGEPNPMSLAINLHNSTFVLAGMILILSSTLVLQYLYTIVSLYYSIFVLQYICTIVRLYYSTFVLQYICIVVRLYYSIFVLLRMILIPSSTFVL